MKGRQLFKKFTGIWKEFKHFIDIQPTFVKNAIIRILKDVFNVVLFNEVVLNHLRIVYGYRYTTLLVWKEKILKTRADLVKNQLVGLPSQLCHTRDIKHN